MGFGKAGHKSVLIWVFLLNKRFCRFTPLEIFPFLLTPLEARKEKALTGLTRSF